MFIRAVELVLSHAYLQQVRGSDLEAIADTLHQPDDDQAEYGEFEGVLEQAGTVSVVDFFRQGST